MGALILIIFKKLFLVMLRYTFTEILQRQIACVGKISEAVYSSIIAGIHICSRNFNIFLCDFKRNFLKQNLGCGIAYLKYSINLYLFKKCAFIQTLFIGYFWKFLLSLGTQLVEFAWGIHGSIRNGIPSLKHNNADARCILLWYQKHVL